MNNRNLKKLNDCCSPIDFLKKLQKMYCNEVDSLFGSLRTVSIKKGDYLYRIRKNIGPHEIDPWGTIRKKEYGRFDKDREVLYVAQGNIFLEEEVQLNKGDEYYLGKYKVLRDFVVGFPSFENNRYPKISEYLHKICQAINEKHLSAEEYKLIKSINSEYLDMPLVYSLKLGIDFGPEIYNYTNWIGKKMFSAFPNGFAYTSSYNPIDIHFGETEICLDSNLYNIALTKSGMKNIKFYFCSTEKVKENRSLSVLINEQIKYTKGEI